MRLLRRQTTDNPVKGEIAQLHLAFRRVLDDQAGWDSIWQDPGPLRQALAPVLEAALRLRSSHADLGPVETDLSETRARFEDEHRYYGMQLTQLRPLLMAALAPPQKPSGASDRQLNVHIALHAVLEDSRLWGRYQFELRSALSRPLGELDRLVAAGEPLGMVEKDVRKLLERLNSDDANFAGGDLSAMRSRLLRALGEEADPSSIVSVRDSWGKAVLDNVRSQPTMAAVLSQIATATGVSPTKKWLQSISPLLTQPGVEAFVRELAEASLEVRRLVTTKTIYLDSSPFDSANAGPVRGFYWTVTAGGWSWSTEFLGRAGLYWALSGRNDNYARDQRLASTCAVLLGELGNAEALAALTRIKTKVRNRPVTKSVAAALAAASARAGTSPSELVEMAVPRLGLDASGKKEIPAGDAVAIITIDETGDAELTWRTAAGKEISSVPKSAHESEAVAVKKAKAELKELRAALSVERHRIEELFVENRSWDAATWRERYLDHPLSGSFGRRLLWRVEQDGEAFTFMPVGGTPLDVDGQTRTLAELAVIRLWHPINASAEETRLWRRFVLDRRICQPFKQAFREVYALTPAEEETEVYSNRFAAHVLNYPVARALIQTRRWATNFLGPFDGGFEGIARREFQAYVVGAEFYHDAIETDGDDYSRCSTDQVRFYRLGDRARTAIRLAEVPAIVFSEAMRDVDLFVGVASIAADANWQDNGADRDARFGQYWTNTAFGELGATAESRREVLAWMVPQLAIADRVELLDRWLRVRGDVRTYKIHLGSGNILMEPNDAYLCIVPGRGSAPDVFLPFDDDSRLSLILSKAFMLANDRDIKDPTILRQIRPS